VAGGTAALVLAGAPALASTQALSHAITGPETAYGAIYTSPNAPELAKGAVASFLLKSVLTLP